MTSRSRPPSWVQAGAAGCLLVTACAATPPNNPGATSERLQPLRLAQFGYAREAAFGHCSGDRCPQRTPKTLALVAEPPPLVAAVPAVTLPALAAPIPDTHAGRALDEREEILPIAPVAPVLVAAVPEIQQLDIQFPFASAHLGARAREALRELAPRLARAREISLSGRTDSTGPVAANAMLAKARTDAVLRELETLSPGIRPTVTIDARGTCCYAEPNDSPANRASNRRVEIRYVLAPDAPP